MRRLAQGFDLKVRWVAFPLHPETPEQGQSLEELFAGRGYDIPAILARLARAAAEEGLPFGPRSMTYNSRRAQELAKWAEARGQEEAFSEAVFRAYFAEGRNIALMPVLRDLAAGVGLDPDQAERALAEGAFAPAVDQDWALARASGITAVPTFAAGGRLVVGAQPYPVLEQLARSAGAAPRPPA